MDKGGLLWHLSSVVICGILFLPCRECDAGKQDWESLEARSALQQHAANTLDYEEKAYDTGPGLSRTEYESYEQVDDTVDDYDWYQDYYKKYESFARHTLMSERYQPEFIIENAGLCKDDTAVLILVNSRLRNRFARDKIREVFKKTFSDLRTAYGFFLSKPGDAEMRRQVEKESSVWGDMIVASSEEAYRLLTIKTAYLLHWVASFCPNSTYVAKVDDDVYVNMPRLLSVLDVPRNYTVLGKICTNCVPFRGIGESLGESLRSSASVVVTRRHVPLTRFPPFAMGPAYVLTTDLVAHLLEAALQMVYFEYEDVFWTGQVVDEINEARGVAARPDPESIKDKYYSTTHFTNWEVHHEDVAAWRLDFRGTVTPEFLSLAHQAVTIHGIDWYSQKQFVAALAKLLV